MTFWVYYTFAGDFFLDDVPWSRRQIESDQVKTLIESNQCSIPQEIANILKISKSIKLLVKMENVSFVLWKKTKQAFWPTQ